MTDRLRVVLSTLLLFVPLTTGCSIAMALNGKQEPNFEAFEKGSTRGQVEFQLGQPVSERGLEEGKKEVTYKYEMGNSSNPARASIYFYYDLITIGFAEPVFTVIELFQGRDEESRITYDAQDRVVDIAGYKPPEPAAALKAAMQEQDKYVRKPPPGPSKVDISARTVSQPAVSVSDISTQPSSQPAVSGDADQNASGGVKATTVGSQ